MPEFFKSSDPGYWAHIPEMLKHLQDEMAPQTRLAYFLMGDEGENPPTVAILDLAPGRVLQRHAHEGQRVEVVVRGELLVEDGVVLHPGDVMVSGPGQAYGPHTAGVDGCMTVEIFSNYASAYRATYQVEGKPLVVDYSAPGNWAGDVPAFIAKSRTKPALDS